ncbi:Glucooligosaccharide oxidase [Poronia punctata]|nr:Glucooligosaccharide oxidase [Poronia punctata]
MGQAPSTPLAQCLTAVCNNRADCVAFPSTPFYKTAWADGYNLDRPVVPIAVTRPDNTQDVSDFVKCAVENNVKVQPKSGGHSYANYGLGGEDGALVIDLKKLQDFSMDEKTWRASIGGGTRLDDVTKRLHKNGKRAIAHGTCPGVGIGGHATIGGLGPSSRMWGSCLDHVVEVEVVTADGSIKRASETENEDLFFALKGAGAGFGIITEFVMKTHPEPGSVVRYSFTLSFGSHREMAPVLKQWQDLVTDPKLDRRFHTEFVAHELGAIITATFYGTKEEWEASGIPDRIPRGSISVKVDDWLGVLAEQAEEAALYLSDIHSAFTARSLAFTKDEALSEEAITQLMTYLDDQARGTLLWFLIFDASGGAVSDIPMNATAYSHRDKVMFCQGYGIGIPTLTQTTKDFMNGIIDTIQGSVSQTLTTYPGYVDPALTNPQQSYWGPNIEALESIKSAWDPNDLFHNPQSVRPKGKGKL